MKPCILKVSGIAGALAVFGWIYVVGVRAQPPGATPDRHLATTNWIGYLVVGQNDPADQISIDGPHPTVARQVEIGLRSDGMLVWRKAGKGR